MENKEGFEREINGVRSDIAREERQLGREPIGQLDPVLQSDLRRDEGKVQRLETKEERSKAYEQTHGLGF
jgi:hypothetical protein